MNDPITIKLSGMECRGRNGWYKGHTVDVWACPAAEYRPEPEVELDVRGTKGGGNIIVNITPDEAQEIGWALILAAAKAREVK